MKQSADEKFEQQKETITRLYTVEGLSGRQIASDLHLNRPRLYKKIQEWGLLQPVSALSDGGSQEATDIGTLLEQGCSMAHIAEEMNLSPRQVRYRIEKNPALHLIWEQNKAEHLYNHPGRAELRMQKSSRDYCVENLPGEEWCPIEEFPLYEISNMGRVRREETVRWPGSWLRRLCRGMMPKRLT